MNTVLDELRRSRLFAGLDDAELERVARAATPLSLPAGAMACRRGEKASHIYVLASGRLKATLGSGGDPERVVGHVEPGENFGELALFESGAYALDITAVEDSRLLALSGRDFLELFSQIPRVGTNVIKGLGGRFLQALGMERAAERCRTIGVVLGGPRGRALLQGLADELARRGERTLIIDGASAQPAGPTSALGRTFAEFRLDALPPDLPARLARCDRILWFVEPSDEPRMREVLIRATADAPAPAARIRVVWILRESDQVAPDWDKAWDTGHRHFKVEWRDPAAPTRRQRQGIARLARHLQGVTLGLALAGGGARGMAHLGVLRVFDREGIDFDLMSGTSAGALVGITYASGYDPEWAVGTFTRELTTPPWIRRLPAGQNWNLLAKFRRRAWEPMLRKYFFDWTLQRLPTPFHSVTVDLVAGREVIRDAGDASHAILESMNLPVISRPICRDGMTLVDGAVLNNLPADVLTARGADLVVAVDVSSKLRLEFAGNRPDTPTDRMKTPGFMETVFRVFETQAHGLGSMRTKSVDVMIEPDTSAFDFADFSKTAQLADAGEAAAEQVLPRLRRLLAEREAAAGQAYQAGLGPSTRQ